jgi:surface antigen
MRGLIQYQNDNSMAPEVGDLIVYKPSLTNPYGHVAIVSDIDLKAMTVEIIQQNPGPFSPSRETYDLMSADTWLINDERILGWLRLVH